MRREKWEEQIKWGITAFLVLAAAVGMYLVLTHFTVVRNGFGKLFGILKPIIYGAVMAYLMAPFYDGVVKFVGRVLRPRAGSGGKGVQKKEEGEGSPTPEKRETALSKGKTGGSGFSKSVATVTSLVVLLAACTGVVYMIIPELVKSVTNVVNSFPSTASNFYLQANDALKNYPDIQLTLEELYEKAYSFVSGFMSNTVLPNIRNIVGSLSTGIVSAFSMVSNLLIGIIVMLYLLNMKEELIGQFRKILFAVMPEKGAKAVIAELRDIDKMFGGFISGKIIDSIIIGILTFIVLSIMRMPYVMLVSVVIGITNVIPFFGPFIGAVPCFILIFLASPMQGLYFLIAILVIQQLDGNIIGPRILGESTGVSSFWVLFSILLFGGLFGFVGMIIAVPSWGVIMNLLRRLTNRRLREKGMPVESEHYLKL